MTVSMSCLGGWRTPGAKVTLRSKRPNPHSKRSGKSAVPLTMGLQPTTALASKLVAALVRASAGRRFRDAEPLAIDLPSGRVVVEPNEMAELPNGTVVLRRINTGYKRSDEYDRLDYALYHLAGQARFGKHYSVEALHLTDDAVEVVTITQQKLNRRRDRSTEMLAVISAGWFPPEVDQVTCPRCPHFFICAAAPKGPLNIA